MNNNIMKLILIYLISNKSINNEYHPLFHERVYPPNGIIEFNYRNFNFRGYSEDLCPSVQQFYQNSMYYCIPLPKFYWIYNIT